MAVVPISISVSFTVLNESFIVHKPSVMLASEACQFKADA